MQVEYLSHMGTDRTVLNAARASFNKAQPDDAPITEKDKSLLRFLARGFDQESWDKIRDDFFDVCRDHDEGLIDGRAFHEEMQNLMWLLRTKPSHFIPFAHPQLSFRITAPLAMARQLWKAHIGVVGGDCGYAAWSEQSYRYVEAQEMWLPKEWRKRADNVKQGSSDEPADVNLYDVLEIEHVTDENWRLYKYMTVECGVAPEQARLVLPACTETTWVWTGSLMFFARVVYQRLDADAQKETQELVKQIADKCAELFPYSWEALTTGDIKK
jgi:thymidylate synthase (FAD)